MNNEKAKQLRKDFPIFADGKLVYLDNAATTQKPKKVVESMKIFMENYNANVGRGIYELSETAFLRFEEARKKIADFIGAEKDEIVFTKSSTEGINSLVYTIDSLIDWEKFKTGKNEIVLTEMEHHSNLIPWIQLAKHFGYKIKYIKINEDFSLDLEDAKAKIGENTAIVSVCHVSNVLGTRNDVKKIVSFGKSAGAVTIVDGAQAVGHFEVDVKNLNCDFYVFSGHKVLGPTGIGVLFVKKELQKKLRPFLFGGGIVLDVDYEKFELKNGFEKFEAGTQNVFGAIGLATAFEYIKEIGISEIEKWEKELLKYSLNRLKTIEGIRIYSVDEGSIISFSIYGVHPHDIAQILSDNGVCVRAGNHCAIPLMKKLEVEGLIRVSFSFYNTFQDVDKLVNGLNKVKEKFG